MAAYDFDFYEGNAFNDWVINVTKGGSAFDLTGYAAHLHMWRRGDSDTTLVVDIDSGTASSKIDVTTAASGEITINLTSTETDQEPGYFEYEVFVISSGTTFTVKKGVLRILASSSA
jgi:hypothetical protein